MEKGSPSKAMRLAIAAWAAPLFGLFFLIAGSVLDSVVPWPESLCPPDYEYAYECQVPESGLRDLASALSAEKVVAPVVMLGVVLGIAFGIVAVIQARGRPELRRARNLAIGALVLLFVVPLVLGGLLLLIASVSRISG